MKDNPLVSVILPVYNGEKHLTEVLQSVFAQDYEPMEVIVVDDGSTDKSAEIARSFSGVRYLFQENSGPGAARNRGLEASSGEFVALIDQDDLWTRNKLRVQVGYMIERPEIQYTFCRMRHFLEAECTLPSWFNPELFEQDVVGYLPSGFVARRSVFEQVGQFNTDIKTGSDGDWFFRAKDQNIPHAIVPEVLLHRRLHGFNQSSDLACRTELLRIVRGSVDRKRGRGVEKKNHVAPRAKD